MGNQSKPHYSRYSTRNMVESQNMQAIIDGGADEKENITDAAVYAS